MNPVAALSPWGRWTRGELQCHGRTWGGDGTHGCSGSVGAMGTRVALVPRRMRGGDGPCASPGSVGAVGMPGALCHGRMRGVVSFLLPSHAVSVRELWDFSSAEQAQIIGPVRSQDEVGWLESPH